MPQISSWWHTSNGSNQVLSLFFSCHSFDVWKGYNLVLRWLLFELHTTMIGPTRNVQIWGTLGEKSAAAHQFNMFSERTKRCRLWPFSSTFCWIQTLPLKHPTNILQLHQRLLSPTNTFEIQSNLCNHVPNFWLLLIWPYWPKEPPKSELHICHAPALSPKWLKRSKFYPYLQHETGEHRLFALLWLICFGHPVSVTRNWVTFNVVKPPQITQESSHCWCVMPFIGMISQNNL